MIPSQLVTRRHVVAGALLLVPAAARAGAWPERPIRMIIPFVAGAGADIVPGARLVVLSRRGAAWAHASIRKVA